MGGRQTGSVAAVTGIEALARRCDRYRWWEQQLFAVLGEASRTDTQPARRAVLASHSQHHGWHAELWAARRPTVFEPADLAGALGDVIAALDVAGAYAVVLPALADAYRDHRAHTDPRLDAPTARCLDLVLADVEADLAEGRRWFRATPDGGAAVLLDAAAGIAGPDVW